MDSHVGRLVGRQVDRHARIYIASFEPAKGRLQKLVYINMIICKKDTELYTSYTLDTRTFKVGILEAQPPCI